MDSLAEPNFAYVNGLLQAEAVPLARIAAAVGTPFYCYSADALRRNYRNFAQALSNLPASIAYGVKANSNLAVIRVLAKEGAGADIVSEGEMRKALAAGVAASRIIFSGVGKTRGELAAALDAGVGQFNVESEAELAVLDEIARGKGKRAPAALRINPNIDAKTHSKITTGRKQDKFGIAFDRAEDVYARAAKLPGIEPVGLAVHIGSQILSLDPYRRAFKRVASLAKKLRGGGLPVTRLDLGGGIGIVYRDEQTIALQDYADMVEETFGRIGCELAFEPGRAIAGSAGVMVSSVVYVKDGGMRPIVVVDAAMNDLIRPALYEAFHPIVPLRQPAAGAREQEIDVVGPICESGDTFAQQRLLPDLAPGDMIAFGAAGAYGAVMASTYNSRLLVPEVLVDGDQFAVIRPRPSFDDLLRCDSMPAWLDDASARLKRGAA